MRLLVTGADGFVGRWLVRAALRRGHDVIASILASAPPPAEWRDRVAVVTADLRVPADYDLLAAERPDTVVHLAAIASGAEARRDPDAAMQVNEGGTALLVQQLARTSRPRFLLVSTAEVYGAGHDGPIAETAALAPVSPYGLSKVGAEHAALAELQSSGLPVIIARPFPHTGPGQSPTYVLPALATRLLEAKRTGALTVPTGNLTAVRDFLDVRDVVEAYLLLVEAGEAGTVYNVGSGIGRRLSTCFADLAGIIGTPANAVPDAALLRPDDIPVLIGDATRLRQATGWAPSIPFEQTLQDLVNAQAD
ncbi:MAG TPA: NAD-dependent epimerase/dehydratase family protein [Gemmatimonadales bacterium]|jgi:GDP-4-dehydro-6-deoxy-D-mannose reductase